MAQEIRIEPTRRGPPRRRQPTREPRTTEEARRAIEATRGRISATLDEIEDRIGETREQVKAKVNVLRPVRSGIRRRPWPGLGIAFGTGLLFGLLTGGEEEEEARAPRRGERPLLSPEARHERRRWRATRRARLEERRHDAHEQKRMPSALGQIRSAAMSAALLGLADRIRCAITGPRTGDR